MKGNLFLVILFGGEWACKNCSYFNIGGWIQPGYYSRDAFPGVRLRGSTQDLLRRDEARMTIECTWIWQKILTLLSMLDFLVAFAKVRT